MFINQPSAASLVSAGSPGPGLDQYFDRPSGRHAKQAETKETTEFPHTRIAQSIAACFTDGKPNLITRGRAIYRLQQEFKTEGKLKFTDHDNWLLDSTQRDEITAADLALDHEAECSR